MSVLVKGMEMPKNCMECAIRSWSPDECDVCPFSGIIALCMGVQHDCPLVEVPTPHGRLVEFIDVVVMDDEDTGMQEINLGKALSAYLKMRSAPTVIEAEGEE